MLKGFSGYLQTDGYSTYNVVESVTRVGCWAHARRKWVDCFEGKKPVEENQSEKAFAYIYGLFYRFGLIDVPEKVKEKMTM